MEVEQVFHMKEGTGEASYANNSKLQKLVISKAKTVVETSLKEMFSNMLPECLMVADLGCSSGPNALLVLKEIVDITDETYRSMNRRPPEFKVFLNDLPGNDFNTIFRLLQGFRKRLEEEKGSDFEPCFVSGTPGSFYQRLFPRRLLHFVHSANSLHWISQVPKGLEGEDGIPLNKGRVCAGSSSPPEVLKAYRDQFTTDFSSFLKARSEEIVPGGFMSLTIVERSKNDDIFKGWDPWELLSKSLQSMASEGLIEQEKLDAFNVPYYAPLTEELKDLIEAEGSFTLHKLESVTVDLESDFNINDRDEKANFMVYKAVRPVLEPILASEFGQDLMDDLFRRFQEIGSRESTMKEYKFTNLAISLMRK